MTAPYQNDSSPYPANDPLLDLPPQAPDGRIMPPDPHAASLHEAKLQQIAALFGLKSAALGLPTGYTYWGQFLAHELIPRQGLEPVRSSVLDLDSLYGTSPESCSNTPYGSSDGRFTMRMSCRGGAPIDLARGRDGKACIPDERNDENLIIAQLHLLMQRAHNAIVARLASGDPDPAQTARHVLTGLFHRFVQKDYLRAVTLDGVYRHLLAPGNDYLQFNAALPLPPEVTHAAFRFGHSQIRDDYNLNDRARKVKLLELFRLTGADVIRGPEELPEDHAVDWSFFFRGIKHGKGNTQHGFIIDSTIVQAMRQPALLKAIMLSVPSLAAKARFKALEGLEDFNIVHLNLLGGIKACLPSGEALAAEMLRRFPALAGLGIGKPLNIPDPELRARIHAAGIDGCTPLWLYLLLEAAGQDDRGRKLGPLGSFLLCETLKNAIRNAGIDYAADLDTFEADNPRMTTLSELINFTLDHEGQP